MRGTDICFLTATELARFIRDKVLSSVEVMQAHLDQIDRINPKVNAIVTLVAERALADAAEADRSLARGDAVGPLHGIPVAHKDLVRTKGIRTTLGSPIFRDLVPDEDALIVERLRTAGAITVGKTNTPEFGAGSQTYNEVFGETLNPHDTTKTCGGSSGGAAVALACGMVPLADGSDMAGSLRNPANFCNVVGLRPSPGRVPIWPARAGWATLNVQGPMARTVQDVALMLSVIAGPDPRSPISISESGARFAQSLDRDFRGVRVAWSRDLGGLPVDPAVTAVLEDHRRTFASLGCEVDDGEPDFTGANEVFHTLRAWNYELLWGHLMKDHRHEMKETVVWNIEKGQRLSGPELGRAEVLRTALFHRVRTFMEKYEFLICPVNQALPFPIEQRYIDEINGVKMETYIDWMKSCYYITAVGLPAISVPCGVTPAGLPVGVQIVGRHHDDFGVLQLANAFEEVNRQWMHRPGVVAQA